MISRGHFIGEIIDDLIGIAYQVDNRCMLGLTDINKFLEDFFKEVINRILGTHLVNLNAERANEPGLDLGDPAEGLAFQITSQKTSTKINNMLEKLTSQQLSAYSQIKVLVIGSKQGSYTLNDAKCREANFSSADIWDIGDLCKKSMDLPLDALQALYSYVRSEIVRIKIELEVPAPDGAYPTSISDFVERIAKPKLSTFERYHKFHKARHDEYEASLEQVQNDFKQFSNHLSRLPRITRDFYAFLVDRRDAQEKATHTHTEGRSFRFNYDRLIRICRYSDIEGELRLLTEEEFVTVNYREDVTDTAYVRIWFPRTSEYFNYDLTEFMTENGIAIQKALVSLDFSDF